MKTTQDTRQATQDTTPTHTPGPWNADKNFMGPDTYGDGNSIPVFPRGGGVAICDVVAVTGEGLSRPDVQARAEANARLIAAAPELLEALEKAADWLSRSIRIDDREQAEDARAAIAKATGGTL
jgi:hypothetical protein